MNCNEEILHDPEKDKLMDLLRNILYSAEESYNEAAGFRISVGLINKLREICHDMEKN